MPLNLGFRQTIDHTEGTAKFTFLAPGVPDDYTSYTFVASSLSVVLAPTATSTDLTPQSFQKNMSDLAKFLREVHREFVLNNPQSENDRPDANFRINSKKNNKVVFKYDLDGTDVTEATFHVDTQILTFEPRSLVTMTWYEFVLWVRSLVFFSNEINFGKLPIPSLSRIYSTECLTREDLVSALEHLLEEVRAYKLVEI